MNPHEEAQLMIAQSNADAFRNTIIEQEREIFGLQRENTKLKQELKNNTLKEL